MKTKKLLSDFDELTLTEKIQLINLQISNIEIDFKNHVDVNDNCDIIACEIMHYQELFLKIRTIVNCFYDYIFNSLSNMCEKINNQ